MNQPNPQYIQSIAPSKRSAITEDQAALFSSLIIQYQCDLLTHFKLIDVLKLDLNRHEEAREIPSYGLLLMASYACGFVCRDLDANFDVRWAHQHMNMHLGDCNLKNLRHYIHTLFRSERVSGEHGSPVLEAYKAGALSLVAERLKSDESLREATC